MTVDQAKSIKGLIVVINPAHLENRALLLLSLFKNLLSCIPSMTSRHHIKEMAKNMIFVVTGSDNPRKFRADINLLYNELKTEDNTSSLINQAASALSDAAKAAIKDIPKEEFTIFRSQQTPSKLHPQYCDNCYES